MARRNRRFKRRTNQPRPRRRSRRNNRFRRASRPTLMKAMSSGLVAEGIKNIVAYFPGAPLVSAIASAALAYIGVSSSAAQKGTNVVAAGTAYVGAATKFLVSAANILSGSPHATPLERWEGSGKIVKYNYIPYLQARVLEVVVEFVPQNAVGSRQGLWYAGLSPIVSLVSRPDYGTTSDLDDWLWNGSHPEIFPTSDDVRKFPVQASGQQGRPLRLVYRPRPCDGEIFTYTHIGVPLFGVLLVYEDPMRDDYGPFKASDLSFQIKVSGRVELKSPLQRPIQIAQFDQASSKMIVEITPEHGFFQDALQDQYPRIGAFIIDKSTGKRFIIGRDMKHQAQEDGYVTVSGVIVDPRSLQPPQTTVMAIG